jgi:hypothetical protein
MSCCQVSSILTSGLPKGSAANALTTPTRKLDQLPLSAEILVKKIPEFLPGFAG